MSNTFCATSNRDVNDIIYDPQAYPTGTSKGMDQAQTQQQREKAAKEEATTHDNAQEHCHHVWHWVSGKLWGTIRPRRIQKSGGGPGD